MTTLEIGKEGEEIALNYLKGKGYRILEQNWRFGNNNEVDIIALDRDYLVFVEVKSRKKGSLQTPVAAVDRNKQRILIRAANAYISRYDMDYNARFDIIGIEFSREGHTLEHIDQAFYPTLRP
ncbi:MAG TPA: YraN family protein [Bacteroidales bacterium]|nr:YraN family protein [Lentimicrobiaceae bacterium]HOI00255.1 YraN family protein [Bacteroidales bacterium]